MAVAWEKPSSLTGLVFEKGSAMSRTRSMPSTPSTMKGVRSNSKRGSALGALVMRSAGANFGVTGSSSSLGTVGSFSLQKNAGLNAGLDALGSLGSFLEQNRLRAERAARVTATVESDFDVAVWISLEQGQVDGPELPLVVAANAPCQASYSGGAEGIEGTITIEGFRDSIGFRVRAGTPTGAGAGPGDANYVAEKGKLRAVVTMPAPKANGSEDCPRLPLGAEGAPGISAELRLSKDSLAGLKVVIRRATEAEVRRFEARCALREAEDSGDYGILISQIGKAKAKGVEGEYIERAQLLLKSLQPKASEVLSSEQLLNSMRWNLVTTAHPSEHLLRVVHCDACETCSCNANRPPEEELTFTSRAISTALQDVAPPNVAIDRWFFELLVEAAVALPEGCVWKSGGKFILTTADRNQSAGAILQSIQLRHNVAAEALRALKAWTEQRFDGEAIAIQMNFHPNHESFHALHRDNFSKQRFAGLSSGEVTSRPGKGTACFSLGSMRQVLCETCTDAASSLQACCADCSGRKEYRWMESGDMMYFNAAWNQNHMHGVPPALDHACGPRISIAFIIA